MNLGMDFGSTYTIVSTYRTGEHPKIEALELDSSSGSVNIPSVISDRRGDVRYGTDAKDRTGKRNTKTYKAFKMLLNEENKDLIKERNYDEKYSPRWATEAFMDFIINKAQSDEGIKEIENLVIGAPDVWFHSFDTLSGRALIRDICKSIEGVQNVQIISEPVLASAYFAYNFMNKKGKPFEGNILIIDYGGGTLDLSLTNVSKGIDTSMEIKSLYSNGAGENTEHTIGNAGIVYMESLMEHIIKKNTPELLEEIIGTEEFYEGVNNLEKELKSNTEYIETRFKRSNINNLEKLETITLKGLIDCGDESYKVTFKDLLDVYRDKIYDVFEEKMDDMIRWARENNIDVLSSQSDNIRIARVGGFGNFYLVKRQMNEKFKFSNLDRREEDIIGPRTDRERSISYGAALIASGVVGICNTAPYSIGISSKDPSGKELINYMVRYKDEIELDKCYDLLHEDGSNINLILAENELKNIVIDYGEMGVPRIDLIAKDEFINRLRNLLENPLKACWLGVSFGRSDILSLHIREYGLYTTGKPADEEQIIEIGDIKEFFFQKKRTNKEEESI